MAIEQLIVRTDAEELVELRRQIDELEHRFAAVLTRFARSREWELDGAVSPTAWLRWKCGLGSQAASVRVAVANTIEELPVVGEALWEGRMSFAQVQSVAAVTEVVGAEAMRPGVEAVIDVAQRLTADRFRFAMRHLRRLIDADGFARDADREHDRRWLALSESYDGVYFIEGRLDAEGGAILKAALDPLMKPVRDDDRTARQRRADALSSWRAAASARTSTSRPRRPRCRAPRSFLSTRCDGSRATPS